MPNRAMQRRNQEIYDQVRATLKQNPEMTTADVARLLGISESTARRARSCLLCDGEIAEARPCYHRPAALPPPEPEPQPVAIPIDPAPQDVGYPEDDKDARIRTLESELESLRGQVEWTTHHGKTKLSGGLFTLNISDLHLHDKGHMLSSLASVEEKFFDLLHRFKPAELRILVNGDTVPGAGIYRNQMMEAVLPKADQQIGAATWRLYQLDQQIAKKHPKMAREWCFIHGNHDYSFGDPTTIRLVAALRNFDVTARFMGMEWVQNCAHKGTYNILFLHGYGYSAYAQASHKMVAETTCRVLEYWMRGVPIHRVAHAHVHWRVSDFYRGPLPWDTTGGFQRFERAGRGANTRPVGCIAYLSPPGADDILKPIEIIPATGAFHRDMDDPQLEQKNRAEAARNVLGFYEEAKRRGIVEEMALAVADD